MTGTSGKEKSTKKDKKQKKDKKKIKDEDVPKKGTPARGDHLDEDPPIPGQKYFCVTFLSPEGIRNCKSRMFKIRGVYATKKEADERAKKLGEEGIFDVFVGEMGKWLEFDPNTKDIKEQHHANPELNEIMKERKAQDEKTKKIHKQRVDASKEFVNDSGKMKKIRNEMRQKLKNKELGGEDITGTKKKQKEISGALDKKQMEKYEKKITKEQQKLKDEQKQNLAKFNDIQKKEADVKKTDKEIAEIKAAIEKLENQSGKNNSKEPEKYSKKMEPKQEKQKEEENPVMEEVDD